MVRGVAIVWVVYLHVYFSLWPDTPAGEVWFIRVSHLFAHGAVPAFLFVSGFLLARDRSPNAATFLARRARRVLLPGVVWLTLAFLWTAWRQGGVTRPLIEAVAWFDVAGQFYFLVVLAALTVMAYPVLGWTARRTVIAAAVALLVSAATVAWYEQQEITGTLARIAYRNPLVWAAFLFGGLGAARLWPDLRWPRHVTLGAVVVMAVAGGAYVWMAAARGYVPASYFGVTVFAFNAAAVLVWPVAARAALGSATLGPAARAAQWLAPLAFAIYLVHQPYFVGWWSDLVVSDSPMAGDYLGLMLALLLVGGATTLAFVLLAVRVWPWGARVLMGVERPSREPGQGRCVSGRGARI